MNSQTQSRLFSLPAELRTRIFELVVARRIGIKDNAIWIGPRPPPLPELSFEEYHGPLAHGGLPHRCRNCDQTIPRKKRKFSFTLPHRAPAWTRLPPSSLPGTETHRIFDDLPIIRTCRLAFQEAQPLLYSTNLIVGNGQDLATFLDEKPLRFLLHIKAVKFTLDANIVTIGKMLRCLPNLKVLHLTVPRQDDIVWTALMGGDVHDQIWSALSELRGVRECRLFVQDWSIRNHGYLPEVDRDIDGNVIRLSEWWIGQDIASVEEADQVRLDPARYQMLRQWAEGLAAAMKQPRSEN